MKNTMKKILGITVIAVTGIALTVAASMIIPASPRARARAKAPGKSPVIGDNWDLERVDFIHYAKPTKPGGGKGRPRTCYKLLGLKWKTLPVSYVINPSNPNGLTDGTVTRAISTGAETWDNATSSELFSSGYTVSHTAAYGVQDYENAVVFGDYPNNNAIAVTSIWFTRKGKQIVEFDMILNTRFTWGDASSNPSVMDIENIACHEFGHSIGLDDIYSDSCSHVTMYGYSDYGETQKRTLEQADKTGVQSLY